MRSRSITRWLFPLVVCFLACVGCQPDERDLHEPLSSSTGTLRLLLTDSPIEGNVEAITVTISRVDIVFADEGIPHHIIIPPNTTFNLLDLQDGVTAVLGIEELPVGIISQLRLIIEDASITIDGETSTLFIPSGVQTGVKLNGNFEISPCFVTTVTIDFDAKKSVRYPPGLEHSRGYKYLLQPVITIVSVESDFDVTPPSVQFSPEDGSFVNVNPVPIHLDFTNGAGVDVSTFEATFNSADVTSQFTVSPDMADATLDALEGNNTVQIVLSDVCDNFGTYSSSFFVDTIDPVIEIDSPVEFLYLVEQLFLPIEIDLPLVPGIFVNTEELSVGGTIYDGGSGVAEVTVNGITASIDGDRFTATVSLSDGNNEILATAVDRAGNEDSDTIEVVLDTVPPDPPEFEFLPSSTTEDHINLTGYAEPKTLLRISGGMSVARATVNDSGDFSIDVTLQGNEVNSLSAIVIDAAGNPSTGVSFSVIQNFPPALTIMSPPKGYATKEQTVTVEGLVSDIDPVSVSVGGMATPVVNGMFSSHPIQLSLGVNSIAVTAIDSFGGTTSVLLEVMHVGADVPDVFGSIDTQNGGRVSVLDRSSELFGTSIVFPPGSLTADSVVTLTHRKIQGIDNPGHIVSGPMVEVWITGGSINPNIPARLTLPYRGPIVGMVGKRHDMVSIHRLDISGFEFEFIDIGNAKVDPGLGIVSAPIVETSVFQAFLANPDGFILSTEIGDGGPHGFGEGWAPNVPLTYPSDIAFDARNGHLYFTQGDITDPIPGESMVPDEVWRRRNDGWVERVFTVSDLNIPSIESFSAIEIDPDGNVIIGATDFWTGQVRGQVYWINIETLEPILIAGGGPSTTLETDIATNKQMNVPTQLDLGSSGEIYVAEGGVYTSPTPSSVVRMITPSGMLVHVAGTGEPEPGPDPDLSTGLATSIRLNFAAGVALKSDGNGILYIADSRSHVIRAVNLSDTIYRTVNGVDDIPPKHMAVVAGTGNSGFYGDGGRALEADLYHPFNIEMDQNGNLFLSERDNSVIRVIDRNGFITRIAGKAGVFEFLDGPASLALLKGPIGITMGEEGVMYIADRHNNRIRKLTIPPYPGPGQRDFICTESCVSYRYLGVNGAEIRIYDELGNLTYLLLDPYFSRLDISTNLFGNPTIEGNINDRIGSTELDLENALKYVDAVLITHSHYDHLADVFNLQVRSRTDNSSDGSGFVVISPKSAYNLLRGFRDVVYNQRLGLYEDADTGSVYWVSDTSGDVSPAKFDRLDPDNIIVSDPTLPDPPLDLSDPIFSNGEVTIKVDNALHGIAENVVTSNREVLNPGNVTTEYDSSPSTAFDYKEGGSLSFLIEVGSPPAYILYIQGGAGNRGDLVGEDQDGLSMLSVQPDMALMNLAVWEAAEDRGLQKDTTIYQDFFDGFIPEKVIPLHYDDFFIADPKPLNMNNRTDLFENEISSFVSSDNVYSLRYGGCQRSTTTDDANPLFSPEEENIAQVICGDTMCPFIDRF